MAERKICEFCKNTPKKLEEKYASLKEREKVFSTITDFEELIMGKDCKRHYTCLPLIRLKARLEVARQNGR